MKVITANLLNRFWTNGVKPIKTAVGTISSLTTAAKTNLVAAINEVKAKADSNATEITSLNNNLGSHNHDSRYYTEAEINAKLALSYPNTSVGISGLCGITPINSTRYFMFRNVPADAPVIFNNSAYIFVQVIRETNIGVGLVTGVDKNTGKPNTKSVYYSASSLVWSD